MLPKLLLLLLSKVRPQMKQRHSCLHWWKWLQLAQKVVIHLNIFFKKKTKFPLFFSLIEPWCIQLFEKISDYFIIVDVSSKILKPKRQKPRKTAFSFLLPSTSIFQLLLQPIVFSIGFQRTDDLISKEPPQKWLPFQAFCRAGYCCYGKGLMPTPAWRIWCFASPASSGSFHPLRLFWWWDTALQKLPML